MTTTQTEAVQMPPLPELSRYEPGLYSEGAYMELYLDGDYILYTDHLAYAQAYAAQRVAEVEAKLAVAEADLLPLQIFLDSVFGEFPEHGDIDALDIQEIAETCGLLKREMKTVPCGEACACAEYVTGEKTIECDQVQPVMSRARNASAKHTAALTSKEQP